MNGSQAHKVGPEEASGPKQAPKVRGSKPIGSMQKSENRPHQAQSNVSKESKKLMEDPLDPRMKYKVIGPRKPKRVSKGPWESKIGKWPRKSKESKWAKDAQEENGTQQPVNSVRKGPVNTLSHWEGNKQQAQRGPTRLSQATLQQEQQSGTAEKC